MDMIMCITSDRPYQGAHYDEKTILFSCIVTTEPFKSPNETMKFQTFADLYYHNIYPTFNTFYVKCAKSLIMSSITDY